MSSSLLVPRLASANAPDVEMSFQWSSERVPNALATLASTPHVLANDSVDELVVSGPRATLVYATFDPETGTYATGPVRSADLDRLLDPATPPAFTVDLRFTYTTFFDVLLAQMTRTDEDLHNLAHPNDPDEILGTFDHALENKKPVIAYHEATHRMREVPCRLVDLEAAPSRVKLRFELQPRRGDMRKLIAMDWSALARFTPTSLPPPRRVEVWRDNVMAFLANQTDMARAERFRTSIATRHATKAPKQLAEEVRKDIDRLVVTANHWGEARENPKLERHQALLADLLSTLQVSAWLASPLCHSRQLAKLYGLSLDQRAALTLQYGAGHCGEHGRTSFSILRTIMTLPDNQLDSIVLCGNANIDHGFVLCNLRVTHVLLTTATSPANTRVGVGQEIRVFNLRDALAANPTPDVFVVDPYLDPSMMRSTGAGLLVALNNKNRRKDGKDTDFLIYQTQHPVPAELVTDDIRTLTFDERMAMVRNI